MMTFCERPVSPGEDLFVEYKDSKKDDFFNRLTHLVRAGEKAIKSSSDGEAISFWRKIFGSRFDKNYSVPPCSLKKFDLTKTSHP